MNQNRILLARIQHRWKEWSTQLYSSLRLGTFVLALICGLLLWGLRELGASPDLFNLNSSHWIPVGIGVIGSISSFLAFFWAIGIYQNSVKDGKQLEGLLTQLSNNGKSIQNNTAVIENLTKELTDASRKQHEGLENIIEGLKFFLEQNKENNESTEFYLLSDTLAIGELHYLFNEHLKDKNMFHKNCADIEHIIQQKVEELADKKGKIKIATLKYLKNELPSHFDKDESLLQQLNATRLVKKFVLPVLSELHQTHYDTLQSVLQANSKFKKRLSRFLNEHHRVETELRDRLEDTHEEPIQYVKHLHYQLCISVNRDKNFYSAFVIQIGTYNMHSVSNARALVTYDKTLVNTFIDVYNSFVAEQTKKDVQKNEIVEQSMQQVRRNIQTLQQKYKIDSADTAELRKNIEHLLSHHSDDQLECLERGLGDDNKIA